MIRPVVRPVVRSVVQSVKSRLGRYYLNAGYIDIPPWTPSSVLCEIPFEFICNTPGTGDQYIYDNDGSDHDLMIAVTTGVLTCHYIDVDGTTPRTITGTTIVAGQKYRGRVVYKADGVDLIVDGDNTYTGANAPEVPAAIDTIRADSAAGNVFDGKIYNVRLADTADPTNDRAYDMDDGPGTPKNLWKYANQFDNAAWNKTRGAITPNTTVAPDGQTTMDTMVCNATSANGMSLNQAATISSGARTTIVVYLKKGDQDFALINHFDGTANGVRQWFNLATGAVASSNTFGSGWTKHSASITDVGGGIYRLQFTANTTGTTDQGTIYPSVPADLDFDCETGVTTGYLWGGRIFEGLDDGLAVPTRATAATAGSIKDRLNPYGRAVQVGTVDADWTWE